ncbi:HU family DNA-binding protein [Parabacteroides sp.]
MNKRELIKQVAVDTGMPIAVVKNIFEAILNNTTTALQNGESVTIMGFGALHPWQQNGRPARNPKNGTPVMLQPRTSVKFRIGIDLLKAMNK